MSTVGRNDFASNSQMRNFVIWSGLVTISQICKVAGNDLCHAYGTCYLP